MSDLAEFLLARVAEREKVANAALARVRRWPKTGPKTIRPPWVQARAFAQEERHAALEAFEGRETPEEVLADCQARRQIIALHASNVEIPGDEEFACCKTCHDYRMHDAVRWPCQTIIALAQPLRDHPDFDPAWAVDHTPTGGRP